MLLLLPDISSLGMSLHCCGAGETQPGGAVLYRTGKWGVQDTHRGALRRESGGP